jgi:cyclic pyranopterin phosphate synthase
VTGQARPQSAAPPRVVSYLRLSITDRCNLRCRYCMPESGVRVLPHAEILTFDEIEAIIAAVAGPLGLSGIRVTGGEPLVRGGVVDLVRRLARLPGSRACRASRTSR